jgi:SAM-dependent methyltransferase
MPRTLLRDRADLRARFGPPFSPFEWQASGTDPRDLLRLIDTVNARHRSVYDALADEYAAKSAVHLATTRERVDRVAHHIDGHDVLDVGCGVGLALSIFSSRDFNATGVDVSPRMVKLARERSPQAEVVHGDFLTTKLRCNYDAIWEQALIHLFPRAWEQYIFERFRALLKPAGLLSLSTTASRVSREGWQMKKDYGTAPKRYRRSITESELLGALRQSRFHLVEKWITTDPMGKHWLTVVARKSP